MTTWYFYPRPPRGGRLVFFEVVQHIVPFLSTPSARRATFRHDHRRDRRRISIHALREEGDLLPAFLTRWTTRFLSTPSARRATDGDISHYAVIEFLSTPSARRATSNNSFSIRFFLFLSTPSARRATIDQQAEIDSYLISIHALREEGDTYRWSTLKKPRYFYPRPPRGGRHHIQDAPAVSQQISIHALREEGDLLTPRGADVDRYFYPRPPRGGRLIDSPRS